MIESTEKSCKSAKKETPKTPKTPFKIGFGGFGGASSERFQNFHLWSPAELAEKGALVQECLETFGPEAARQLSERLGFPIPPGADDI
jgi:hypothetical protein